MATSDKVTGALSLFPQVSDAVPGRRWPAQLVPAAAVWRHVGVLGLYGPRLVPMVHRRGHQVRAAEERGEEGEGGDKTMVVMET
jgi:hypothetical protein